MSDGFREAFYQKEKECLELRDRLQSMQNYIKYKEENLLKDNKKLHEYILQSDRFVKSVRLKLSPEEQQQYLDIGIMILGDGYATPWS